eukprot:227243-Chlamydomonas_euryale.AAC.17
MSRGRATASAATAAAATALRAPWLSCEARLGALLHSSSPPHTPPALNAAACIHAYCGAHGQPVPRQSSDAPECARLANVPNEGVAPGRCRRAPSVCMPRPRSACEESAFRSCDRWAIGAQLFVCFTPAGLRPQHGVSARAAAASRCTRLCNRLKTTFNRDACNEGVCDAGVCTQGGALVQ